ncbi:MAG: hypothetical protein KKB31_01690 [Nanoarchaeota archaeon]|nr:hypothetical protein [Nanoarchaeota archaeon]
MPKKKEVKAISLVSSVSGDNEIPPNRTEKYFVVPLLAILIFIVSGLIFMNLSGYFDRKVEEKGVLTCGDGTFYEACSLNEPFYCQDGVLVEKASLCGCSGGGKQGDSCSSEYKVWPKNIRLKYIFNSEAKYLNYISYGGLYGYLENLSRSIIYLSEEKPFRVDFKLESINEPKQKEALLSLVAAIQNLADEKVDQARIAISIVQNIEFSNSGRKIDFWEDFVDYERYPYEVLYEYGGVCGEKANLLAFLLREIGYGVVLFYHPLENHEALGIACPVENSYKSSGYCFVETSGPAIITDDEMEYVGGITLESYPEFMLISEGISLPKDLPEYKDAEDFKRIRNEARYGGVGTRDMRKLKEFKAKYGLVEIYNV